MKIVHKQTKDALIIYRWEKTSTYIVFAIGFIVIGRIWFEGIQSIATYLGLLSAGVAIALKDPLTNIAGWLFILSRSPFLLTQLGLTLYIVCVVYIIHIIYP